jgi:hypothetical protein
MCPASRRVIWPLWQDAFVSVEHLCRWSNAAHQKLFVEDLFEAFAPLR